MKFFICILCYNLFIRKSLMKITILYLNILYNSFMHTTSQQRTYRNILQKDNKLAQQLINPKLIDSRDSDDLETLTVVTDLLLSLMPCMLNTSFTNFNHN